MRTLVAVLLTALLSGAADAGPPIDLNAPNALKLLQARNPAHYKKVSAILLAVADYVSPDMAPWIETTFGATEVDCAVWRVSNPPQLTVSFSLDKTRYTAIVVTGAGERQVLR